MANPQLLQSTQVDSCHCENILLQDKAASENIWPSTEILKTYLVL